MFGQPLDAGLRPSGFALCCGALTALFAVYLGTLLPGYAGGFDGGDLACVALIFGHAKAPSQIGGFLPFQAILDLFEQGVEALNAEPSDLAIDQLNNALPWVAGEHGEVLGERFHQGDGKRAFGCEGEAVRGQAAEIANTQLGERSWVAPGAAVRLRFAGIIGARHVER